MRFFHSQRPFEQYKPHKSRWQQFLDNKKKKKATSEPLLPEFKNPYKKQFEPNTNVGTKKIVVVVFFIFLAGWMAVLVYLPYFQIKKITFSGNRVIKNEEIQAELNKINIHQFKIWPRDNYFVVSQNKIINQLQNTFGLESVDIKKIFPNEIRLTLYEQPANLILDTGAEYLLLNEEGEIIRSITHENSINTPLIAATLENTATGTPATVASGTVKISNYIPDVKKIKLDIGNQPIVYINHIIDKKNPLEKGFVKQIDKWHEAILEQQGIGRLRYFELLDQNLTLKIFLDQNWYALANIRGDMEEQLHNIKVVALNNAPQEYIDVRLGEKVFWK